MSKFKKGDKIKFKKDWSIFPFDVIEKGETGRITDVTKDAYPPNYQEIWIKPTKAHPELSTWGGEIQVGHDGRLIDDYIKKRR